MSEDTRPAWLIEALANYVRPVPPVEHELRRGDVRVCSSTPDGPEPKVSRLVLVTEVDGDVVHGLLCSNEVEMATDIDLVLEQGEATPYALLVGGDLYLCTYRNQVGALVGELLDDAKITAVERAWRVDGDFMQGYRSGPPLQGPADGRWQFKERELSEGVMPIRNAWLSDMWE